MSDEDDRVAGRGPTDHRERALGNLRRSFPEMPEGSREKLARRSMQQLMMLGVEVLFQSFHNARTSVVADPKYNIWRTIVPATMSCRAAENHFWVSANNSTTRPSRWASFAVRPDGQIVGRLWLHRPGVLITDMVLH